MISADALVFKNFCNFRKLQEAETSLLVLWYRAIPPKEAHFDQAQGQFHCGPFIEYAVKGARQVHRSIQKKSY